MPDEGRPTKYKEEYVELVYKLCLLGMIDKQLADFFEVSVATINNWKKEHPEFLESIKRGKTIADLDVVVSLRQRAMGYSHPEDKVFCTNGEVTVVPTIKHYAPDTAACAFVLKNRQPELWRDKRNIEVDATPAPMQALLEACGVGVVDEKEKE